MYQCVLNYSFYYANQHKVTINSQENALYAGFAEKERVKYRSI